ncbi:Uma2 family endonuclease [Nocardia huaxiensis]|uniref:Uma2 family endonuclease n=1 Tax=Nocardia huaxiensis TaxID=2755382 RepID=A0A7D6VDJ9_9NOCA|nr:Uma2 family endonuclease [Nocardia huaxiensis]QLY32834.1 Uma2 family endonuclease [Nocardia huaxiensis]UFS93419.1 Uma2 family endonuclease [Nocardia huaxiensis]
MPGVLEWARAENLQPEPITLDIWKRLPRDFCRMVEVVNGDVVRAEPPAPAHRNAARRIATMLEAGAETHMSRYNDGRLYAGTDIDLVLWEFPRVTVRRPDVALFTCEPTDVGPLPASRVKIAVEVVSPVTERIDTADKQAEYALAGIPWYWLVWMDRDRVTAIDTHVLVLGQYRTHRRITPVIPGETLVDMPIEIRIDWTRLFGLVY